MFSVALIVLHLGSLIRKITFQVTLKPISCCENKPKTIQKPPSTNLRCHLVEMMHWHQGIRIRLSHLPLGGAKEVIDAGKNPGILGQQNAGLDMTYTLG
jgi:hypothetical protein